MKHAFCFAVASFYAVWLEVSPFHRLAAISPNNELIIGEEELVAIKVSTTHVVKGSSSARDRNCVIDDDDVDKCDTCPERKSTKTT